MKKDVLKNFTKFTGRPVTLLKTGLWHRCFPKNFANFLKTPFLQNTSGWLLLGEDIVLIILWCNRKCGITAKLNIYYPFAIALVLIRSRCQKRKKKLKRVADGVSGFDLYLLMEQLAVLPQIKIICLC